MEDVELTINDISLLRDLQVEKEHLHEDVESFERNLHSAQDMFSNLGSKDEAILISLHNSQKTINDKLRKFESNVLYRKQIENKLKHLHPDGNLSNEEQEALRLIADHLQNLRKSTEQTLHALNRSRTPCRSFVESR